MPTYLKQSTATNVLVGPIVAFDDGVTPKTSLTLGDITARIFKAVTATSLTLTASGGSNDCVHVNDGWWNLELTATDTNTVGRLMLSFRDEDVFMPVWHEFQVVAANVYDTLIAGTDALDVSVIQWLGTAVTAATAGRPDVNMLAINDDTTDAADLGLAIDNANNLVKSNITAISDDTTAATNLEAAYDGTGYVGGTTLQAVDIQSIDGTAESALALKAMCDASLTTGNLEFVVDTGGFPATATQFEVSVGDSTNDHYNGGYVVWTSSAALFGSRYEITNYDGGNTRFTVPTMVSAPAHGDKFVIV